MSLFTPDGLQAQPPRPGAGSPPPESNPPQTPESLRSSDPFVTASPDPNPSLPATPDGSASGQATKQSEPLPELSALLMAQLEGESASEKRRFRLTMLAAALFHLALFFVVFPEMNKETLYVGKPGKVFVMQQARFKKPPARAEKPQQIPKKKAKKIPIPDPTPDEPEPLEVLVEVDLPDLEPTDVDEVIFGIPDGPDKGTGLTGGGTFEGTALQIGNGVPKPVAIFQPQPPFTEEARQARIQGMVIITGIVDEQGDVKNLRVVKGLPLGLDKSAIETIATWKYKPAVFEGRPVAVHFTFTVGFWLQ
ncbi:MAG: TonB family protein [Acidobacteriota bacterium]